MGVLIEAENVVMRNATVEQRFPGGLREYEQRCPNSTFCSDGQLCRVGFMTGADAISFIEYLVAMGFAPPNRQSSPEVALINQDTGFVLPCDWLELGEADVGGEKKAAVAWLRGTLLSELCAPPDWKPGEFLRTTRAELGQRFQSAVTRDGVEVHRSREDGDKFYVGRPKLPRRRSWWRFWR